MNFKCLLEVLKEKEYIEIKKRTNSMCITTEFPAARNKIVNTIPEYAEFDISNRGKTITIMTIEDIESWFLDKMGEETSIRINLRRHFYLDEYRIISKIYMSCMTKERDSDLKLKIKSVQYTDDYIITNIAKEEAQKEKERQKVKEVEDFINSLP